MAYRLVPIKSRPGAFFAIDEADYDRYVVHMPTWGLSGSTGKYLQCDWKNSPEGRKRPRLHRFIMVGLNDSKDIVVDHINGDTLDNRRCNLRIFTQAQNVAHRANMNTNNTSGVRGLYWCNTNHRWIACINHGDTTWWKKSFVDRENAEAELRIKREEYDTLYGITFSDPPSRLTDLQESHHVLDEWLSNHEGSTSNKPNKQSRDAYDERRRSITATKRREERERLLSGPQTEEVVKRLKRLDADDKRAKSRRNK